MEDLLPERLRHDAQASLGLDGHVIGVAQERHAGVCRQRPGGRRPDDHVNRLARCGQRLGHVDELEAHEDRRAHLVGVLDLGLGKRGVAVLAPMNRLATTIDHALVEHRLEDLDIGGVMLVIKREVGVVPSHRVRPSA